MNPRRRRRNPIGGRVGGLFKGVVPMLQTAAIGAAGSIAVDATMGQINPYLPDTVRVQAGRVGAGDAIKAIVTVALGKLLSKPTRGMSVTAAQGALTVQMDRIVRSFLPPAVTSRLAYASPARIIPGTARINPNTMGAYTRRGGPTPLFNAYTRPGGPSPLLNSARRREAQAVR